jgi:zinc-ribbon domain
MAFCTSCGATLEGASKFCTKCGAVVTGAASGTPASGGLAAAAVKPAPVAPATTAPPSGGGALKAILIVVAIIIGIIVLGGAVIGFGVWRIASRSHVEAGKNGARIETPFGTVESNADTSAALRKLGIDVYPGARPLPGGAAVSMGSMSTVTAQFETPDSPDLVEAFYKARFPRSNINVNDENPRTMVFVTPGKGMMNIVIEPRGSMTHITISNVAGVKGMPTEPQPN